MPSNAGSHKKGNKSLAHAKVAAPPEEGKGSPAGRGAKHGASGKVSPASHKASPKKDKKDGKSRAGAIAIGVFAVVMALSMMLPSLSAIFANNAANDAGEQEQADASPDADGASTDVSSDSADSSLTGMDALDASYQTVVTDLEAKLQESPQDLATLLNLGNEYMSWGYAASSYAISNGLTDDATESHVNDLLGKAMGYFDQYLEFNDSPAVRVNRALCQLYSGDTSGATKALEDLTQSQPDYGPAWANLGLCYEVRGDTDSAKEAYAKAQEADPDDEYGSSTFATQRLALIEQEESASSTTTTTDLTGSDATATTGTQGLSDALASQSGTTL